MGQAICSASFNKKRNPSLQIQKVKVVTLRYCGFARN